MASLSSENAERGEIEAVDRAGTVRALEASAAAAKTRGARGEIIARKGTFLLPPLPWAVQRLVHF
jgi:hypothetical protein